MRKPRVFREARERRAAFSNAFSSEAAGGLPSSRPDCPTHSEKCASFVRLVSRSRFFFFSRTRPMMYLGYTRSRVLLEHVPLGRRVIAYAFELSSRNLKTPPPKDIDHCRRTLERDSRAARTALGRRQTARPRRTGARRAATSRVPCTRRLSPHAPTQHRYVRFLDTPVSFLRSGKQRRKEWLGEPRLTTVSLSFSQRVLAFSRNPGLSTLRMQHFRSFVFDTLDAAEPPSARLVVRRNTSHSGSSISRTSKL